MANPADRRRSKASTHDTAAAAPPRARPHQLSMRVSAEEMADVTRCAADASFHGGIAVSSPVVLRKALAVYLAAWRAEAQ